MVGPRSESRNFLELFARMFVADRPSILGTDEMLERRREKKIPAKVIYRNPMRSSHNHFVKTSGLPTAFIGVAPGYDSRSGQRIPSLLQS